MLSPPKDGYRGRVAENAVAGSRVDMEEGSHITVGRGEKEEILCRVDVVRHHGEIRVPFEVSWSLGLAEIFIKMVLFSPQGGGDGPVCRDGGAAHYRGAGL